jgi:hypothetical protein
MESNLMPIGIAFTARRPHQIALTCTLQISRHNRDIIKFGVGRWIRTTVSHRDADLQSAAIVLSAIPTYNF